MRMDDNAKVTRNQMAKAMRNISFTVNLIRNQTVPPATFYPTGWMSSSSRM